MATIIDILPPPLSYPIKLPVLGSGVGQPAMQAICATPGDRIYNVCMVPTPGDASQNIVPDGTPGQGAGYMPHWAYRPLWARLQDVADMPLGASLLDGLNGNANEMPAIRVDLEQLYCPWPGLVTLEGGASPTGQGSPTVIQFAYAWDQSGRHRQRWDETIGELWRRLLGRSTSRAPLRVLRFPVDMRTSPDNNGHTLTFYNPIAAGVALPINRPVMATSVWTPDSQALTLDNGAGTTSVTITTNGQNNRAPLGPYSRVTGTTTSTAIIFGINF